MQTPIGSLVVKVASHCNLNCSYCYEYNMGDDSWRHKPRLLSEANARQIGRRIAEHAARWNLREFGISFHGGEPLLAKAQHLEALVTAIRTQVDAGVALHFGMQSNGMLISSSMAQQLLDLRISVGISLDGPRSVNDRHRLNHLGRSSFDRTVRGIQTLKSVGKGLFAGILSVVDVDADPVETFEFLAGFDPPNIDFLLPHGNWIHPPPHKREPDATTPYADWLIAIFDSWFAGNHSHIEIRTFEEIIEHLAGGHGSLETLGLEPVSLLTIGTDGDIEGVDTMKSTFPGAQTLGLNVERHSFDDALAHTMVAIRQSGADAVSDECRQCRVLRTCGGGYFPHRYSGERGFRNRSVYCKDLYKLIHHIKDRIRAPIAAAPLH